MKNETVQKIRYRLELLNRMKDDYLFIRDRVLECEKNAPEGIELSVSRDYCESCVSFIESMIKFYSRKICRR